MGENKLDTASQLLVHSVAAALLVAVIHGVANWPLIPDIPKPALLPNEVGIRWAYLSWFVVYLSYLFVANESDKHGPGVELFTSSLQSVFALAAVSSLGFIESGVWSNLDTASNWCCYGTS